MTEEQSAMEIHPKDRMGKQERETGRGKLKLVNYNTRCKVAKESYEARKTRTKAN